MAVATITSNHLKNEADIAQHNIAKLSVVQLVCGFCQQSFITQNDLMAHCTLCLTNMLKNQKLVRETILDFLTLNYEEEVLQVLRRNNILIDYDGNGPEPNVANVYNSTIEFETPMDLAKPTPAKTSTEPINVINLSKHPMVIPPVEHITSDASIAGAKMTQEQIAMALINVVNLSKNLLVKSPAEEHITNDASTDSVKTTPDKTFTNPIDLKTTAESPVVHITSAKAKPEHGIMTLINAANWPKQTMATLPVPSLANESPVYTLSNIEGHRVLTGKIYNKICYKVLMS